MPDIFYLFSKWWKQILSIVILSLLIVIIVLMLKPAKYLSVATSLPASSYNTDKASVFSNNTQTLYPAFGTPDDLDMIVGTAQLDTAYIDVAAALGLASHYKVQEQGQAAVIKAAYLLKANTKVIKSDFGELKVKVWDKEKTMAPIMANAITNKLQLIHQDLQNRNNISLIKNLAAGIEKLKSNIDTISSYLQRTPADAAETYAARKKSLIDQVQQYEKLTGEYQLLVDNKPPVLIIVEPARVTDWPDKPRKLPILVATFVLSLLFGLLVALLLEKRKSS